MIRELARAYWDAEESRDLDRILDFFTDDAQWSGPGVSLRGHHEIRTFYSASAERFPHLTVAMGEPIGDDTEAAIPWTATFRDHAGRDYPLSGVNIMRERDGRIASLTTYNDPSTLAPMPTGPLDGRRVLVTGAATGIGAATVERFLADGAFVTGVDIDADTLASLADRIASPLFQPIAADITDPQAVDRLIVQAAGPDGTLDVLVNNAAVFLLAGVGATTEQWQRTLEVNLVAPARIVSAASDALAASGRGSVVNVASVSGHVAQADRWTYNSAKGGVLELTRCQALDLAPRGIRVNSVSPGYIWTDVLDRSADGDRAKWDPLWGQYCMLGRCGEPAEVANTIAYLASESASYVTGADLLVDGGLVSMSPDGKATFAFD